MSSFGLQQPHAPTCKLVKCTAVQQACVCWGQTPRPATLRIMFHSAHPTLTQMAHLAGRQHHCCNVRAARSAQGMLARRMLMIHTLCTLTLLVCRPTTPLPGTGAAAWASLCCPTQTQPTWPAQERCCTCGRPPTAAAAAPGTNPSPGNRTQQHRAATHTPWTRLLVRPMKWPCATSLPKVGLAAAANSCLTDAVSKGFAQP